MAVQKHAGGQCQPASSPDSGKRTGFLGGTDISEPDFRLVCFVCEDGRCASPLAAAALNSLGQPYRISGDFASPDSPPSPLHPFAAAALEARGIHCCNSNAYRFQLSHRLSETDFLHFHRIVAMSREVADELSRRFPVQVNRISLFPVPLPRLTDATPDGFIHCLDLILENIGDYLK